LPAGEVQPASEGPGLDGSAEPLGQPDRERVVGIPQVFGAQRQDLRKWWPAHGLDVAQRRARRFQQAVGPPGEKLAVVVRFALRGRGRRLLDARQVHRPVPRPPTAMIDDQVVQHRLQERAKASFVRIGGAEVATQKPNRELVEQLVGGVGIAHRGTEVATDRPLVNPQQAVPSLPLLVGRPLVGGKQRAPARRELAEVRFGHGRTRHTASPGWVGVQAF